VGIISPCYAEHAAAWRREGHRLEEISEAGARRAVDRLDVLLVVNPNNPDGRHHAPATLLDLHARVGRLIVDESFADPTPHLSLVPLAGRAGLLILRSFGKFWGLAGLRLGFVIGHPDEIDALADMAGPWPVSGSAIEIGRKALADRGWIEATAARLASDAARLDRLAGPAGWRLVGGTPLFRLYDTGDATAAQRRLARHRIWSRRFPYSGGWLRLGLPGGATEWARLTEALEA